jgi:hypothetical protein
MNLEWETTAPGRWDLVELRPHRRNTYRGAVWCSREFGRYCAFAPAAVYDGLGTQKFETLEEAKAWLVAVARLG